jgi:hypothetical protein
MSLIATLSRHSRKLLLFMKTSFLLLTIFAFYDISLKAQNKAHIMDSLRAAGNYKLELTYHLSAYKINPTYSANVYNIACCYALLKNNDSAFYYINKSIELGRMMLGPWLIVTSMHCIRINDGKNWKTNWRKSTNKKIQPLIPT